MNPNILPPASKPYFPMILANGSDVVLLDYSGSMHCHSGHLHLEQHQGTLCGWQKISHHEKGHHMLSVAFFSYRVMRPDDDVYEVGFFDQTFDPITATLVTEAHTGILHLRITAFLADGQPLYGERFEVLWVDPTAQPKVAFLAEQMADPRVAQVSFEPGGESQVEGKYRMMEIGADGAFRMAVVPHGKADVAQPSVGSVEVQNLKPGDVIDRFVTMQDTTHTDCPDEACAKTIQTALCKGFDGVHADHASVWRAYHSNNQVNLPDPELEYSYRLSQYLLRASQHPNGYATHGTYNVLWGGGACCSADLLFFTRAWATSNQDAPIKALADFYRDGAAGVMAREYAKQIDRPGVNYPWFFNVFGRDLFFDDAVAARERGVQKANIPTMATEVFDTYRFFGDLDDLKKRLSLMKDMLDFLLAEIVIHDGDRWSVGELIGADENVNRVNDTCHLITVTRALLDYQDGCRALGLAEDEYYSAALEGLVETLGENYRDGILYPWTDATEILTGMVMYYLENIPEGINAKSIRASHKSDSGSWGLSADNAGRDPNMVWPWQEVATSVAFSSIDPKLAWRRLKNAMRFTDMHGFFVEKIRPDGFWINIGYSTPHACFVWALNSLLATDDAKRLTVAVGLPKSWQNYSFTDIRTPSGYGITFEMKEGRLRRLTIDNSRKETRQIRLRLLPDSHPDHRNETLTLQPGHNAIK